MQFQLSQTAAVELESIEAIVSELEALVGPRVTVSADHERRDAAQVSPTDGIRWPYLARRRKD